MAQKRRAYRPQVEGFEKRDVPTTGLTGSLGIAARQDLAPAPLAFPLHRQKLQAKLAIDVSAASSTADPFMGLTLLDRTALKPGDILVSTEDARISSAIRTSTFSAYSHAALYVGDGKIIDATKLGVRKRSLSDLTDPALRVGVIRVTGVSSIQNTQVLRTAQRLVGKSYNYFGLIFGGLVELTPIYRTYRAVTGEPLKVSGSTLGPGYFCSELVIKAYKSAGLSIAPDSGDTPAGIINYAIQHPQRFQLIGRLVAGAS